ncbi:MAG: hypothetical protein WBQ73_03000 [Candidatus Babeliales bacterium]
MKKIGDIFIVPIQSSRNPLIHQGRYGVSSSAGGGLENRLGRWFGWRFIQKVVPESVFSEGSVNMDSSFDKSFGKTSAISGDDNGVLTPVQESFTQKENLLKLKDLGLSNLGRFDITVDNNPNVKFFFRDIIHNSSFDGTKYRKVPFLLEFMNSAVEEDARMLKKMVDEGYLFRLEKLGLVNIDAIDLKLKQDINLEVKLLLNYMKGMNNEPVPNIDRLKFLARVKHLMSNFVEYDKTMEPLRERYRWKEKQKDANYLEELD